jgi:hypothetical protein
MPTNNEILAAIPSTEPATFSEFLDGLPDTPEKGDRGAWAELFEQLRWAEQAGLVEIEREGAKGDFKEGGGPNRIESLMLTAEGAAVVRRER